MDDGLALEQLPDRVVRLHQPHDLYAIGRRYVNIDQASDRQVMDLLQRVWAKGGESA
ncbi:hypothetical protein [Pseudomonas lopnurensis]|uniref:hypothetical protein n=1 Tax=Pseudomonas lopnurensis TaxID=1477517 RepID=UPI0035E41B76